MDNIITLIVIIIMVVSIINKIRSANKPKASAKSRDGGGLISRINTFLTEVQERIEQQTRPEGGRGYYDWDQLMDEEEARHVSRPRHEESLQDLDLEEEVSTPPTPPSARRRGEPLIQQTRPSPTPRTPAAPTVVAATPARRPRRTLPYGLKATRRNLRRAIVWSEILGPPVALRERSGDRL